MEIREEDEMIRGIVAEVREDFENRKMQRRTFDAQWRLNINYLLGNQYCDINANGDVTDYEKKYFWQNQDSFNHIATVIESRHSKLLKIRPRLNVFPATDNENDVKTAEICKKILDSVCNTEDVSKVISDTVRWSEACGTAFYKVIWNPKLGHKIGNETPFQTGDVQVLSIPPFEIYPESSAVENVEDLKSIIHARAYHIDEIKNTWGVDVEGEDVDIFMLNGFNSQGLASAEHYQNSKKNYAVVLEKYEAPSINFPNGRLIIVAGDKLLHFGELPYVNGPSGQRGFPFVKQTSCSGIGCFWGTSIIERLIPIQRAYNAIKNRKHEYINRASIGVLAVEDGSVDVDNLEEDGLCPGKVLVYRQGSNLPQFMDGEHQPFDFIEEEKTLLDEFSSISGVSDMFFDNYLSKQISGNALELMIEQDENRMLATIDNTRSAIKQVGKLILRLYKQFASVPVLAKIVGDSGKADVFYFTKSDISSDDVAMDVRNDVYDSYVQKKQLVLDLLDRGVFNGQDGKLSPAFKEKILDFVGLNDWKL